jgi:hypothetical protein
MNPRTTVRYWRKSREAWAYISNHLGWKKSFLTGKPIDDDGAALPWYTYPAIEYIRTLAMNDCRVFEYGCGNSSIFWAERAREVYCVENDSIWAEKIKSLNIPRLTVIEHSDRSAYVETPIHLGGVFDIVVIDGRFRRQCVAPACEIVSKQGLIILDNADWYPDACNELRQRGWLQIDFSGLGPIAPFPWTTAIFFRSEFNLKRNLNYRLVGASVPRWSDDD